MFCDVKGFLALRARSHESLSDRFYSEHKVKSKGQVSYVVQRIIEWQRKGVVL